MIFFLAGEGDITNACIVYLSGISNNKKKPRKKFIKDSFITQITQKYKACEFIPILFYIFGTILHS